MAMNSNNHPEDQASIEAMHNDISGRFNDELLTFQDDAYALGRSRGLKEGEELRAQLLQALLKLRVDAYNAGADSSCHKAFELADAVIAKAGAK